MPSRDSRSSSMPWFEQRGRCCASSISRARERVLLMVASSLTLPESVSCRCLRRLLCSVWLVVLMLLLLLVLVLVLVL